MQEKIEGTITLDGLVEGRFTGDDEVEERLRQWVSFVGELGLRFNLDVSGNAFSLLPDNRPVPTAKLGPDPDQALRQALEQLIAALPAEDRPRVFSTLRSAEVRKGQEVQSLYAAAPDGSVQVESRSVEVKTIAPPQPVSTKQRVKLGLIGLLLAAVMIGIAFLFPPVREKFAEFIGAIGPVTASDLTVDAAAYEPYFTVTVKEATRAYVVLVLKRTADYPKDAAGLDAAHAAADTLAKKLAVEALARGYVRIELFNDEGKWYHGGEVRIVPLKDAETMELRIGLPESKHRLKRIELRY